MQNKKDIIKLKKFGKYFNEKFFELNNKLNFNQNKICSLS